MKLRALQTENEKLRSALSDCAPPLIDADFLLGNSFNIPDSIAQAVTSCLASSKYQGQGRSSPSFCLTSTLSQGNPIVYASPEFLRLTGYALRDVIGRNCRFLQGADTEKRDIKKLSRAIKEGREETVILKNYRKDGSAFMNRVRIVPLIDGFGRATFFMGEQCEVSVFVCLCVPSTPPLLT
jgi:PAS domain S-box-containing protein